MAISGVTVSTGVTLEPGIAITGNYSGAVVVAHSTDPYVTAYPWSLATGFGTKYSDPGTAVTSAGISVAFHPSGTSVIIGKSGTVNNSMLAAYAWSNSAGWGTKYSNASNSQISTSVTVVAFNNTATVLAAPLAATPYIAAWAWDNSTGFGTKYANPGTLPSGSVTGEAVTFSPSGGVIALAHLGSPYISAWAWDDATGFGTKYSDPGTLAAGDGYGVTFNPAGNVIVLGHGATPLVTAWAWTDSGGFGAKYSDPTSAPATGITNSIVFTPTGDAVLLGGNPASSRVAAYAWNNTTGFGTKYTGPSVDATGTVNALAMSPDGAAIAAAHGTSPYVSAWPWNSATGFGTKYADPSTLPTGIGRGIAFNSINS